MAACDCELLGKTLSEGEIVLDIRSFYDGEKVDVSRFLQLLKLATIANLVGSETVNAAIKAGYIDEACVLLIQETPHAQMVLM